VLAELNAGLRAAADNYGARIAEIHDRFLGHGLRAGNPGHLGERRRLNHRQPGRVPSTRRTPRSSLGRVQVHPGATGETCRACSARCTPGTHVNEAALPGGHAGRRRHTTLANPTWTEECQPGPPARTTASPHSERHFEQHHREARWHRSVG
jgi:hypothetical protein